MFSCDDIVIYSSSDIRMVFSCYAKSSSNLRRFKQVKSQLYWTWGDSFLLGFCHSLLRTIYLDISIFFFFFFFFEPLTLNLWNFRFWKLYHYHIWSILNLNPLSINPTKWSNTLNNSSAAADELFECVWTFCRVGATKKKARWNVRQWFMTMTH